MVANQREVNGDPGSRTKHFGHVNLNTAVFSADQNSKIFASDASLDDLEFGDSSNDVSFSFSIWMKHVGASTEYFTGNYSGNIYCAINPSGGVTVNLIDGSFTNTNTFNSPQVDGVDIFDTESGNWVHLTFVYTRDSDNSDSNHTEKIQFYKNGSPWGLAVESPNDNYVAMHPITLASRGFTIGSYSSINTNSTNRFEGEMSNYLIFRHDGQSGRSSSVLTDSEVLALYNGGNPMADYTSHSKGADLVAYWKLNSASASGLGTDSSGRGNHLDTIGSAMTIQTNSGLTGPGEVSLPWSQRRMTVPGLMSLRTNP